MNPVTAAKFYNLCMTDDDCERGLDHEGPCGPKDPRCTHPGGCNLNHDTEEKK